MKAPLLALLALLPAGAMAQNPPPPLAVETAAFVYAAANVCGFRIDPDAFDRLLTERGSSASELRLQGPAGGRIRTRFVLLSNRLAQDRNASCTIAWQELGREGTITPGVLQEAPAAQ